jgi:hypothetical protein
MRLVRARVYNSLDRDESTSQNKQSMAVDLFLDSQMSGQLCFRSLVICPWRIENPLVQNNAHL